MTIYIIISLIISIWVFFLYRNQWVYKNFKKSLNRQRHILDKCGSILEKQRKILYDETIPIEEHNEILGEIDKEYEKEHAKYEKEYKEYKRLPGYGTLLFKFWIWDIEKFKK